jgi:hypothetical protein
VVRDVMMTQITVLSGVERRRHWSEERKLALVDAAIVPGASVARYRARCRYLALVDLPLAAQTVQQACAAQANQHMAAIWQMEAIVSVFSPGLHVICHVA